MAKKAARPKGPRKGPEKTRVELRLDPELYERWNAAAEAAGVSVNQLTEGLIQWASLRVVQGEPNRETRDGKEYITGARPQLGCLFIGHLQRWDDEYDEYNGDQVPTGQQVVVEPGYVHCALDFTVRRVVRDDH